MSVLDFALFEGNRLNPSRPNDDDIDARSMPFSQIDPSSYLTSVVATSSPKAKKAKTTTTTKKEKKKQTGDTRFI